MLFVDAIKAAPNDLFARLVYADWLEDNGKGLQSEYLRIDDEIQRLMGSLISGELVVDSKYRQLNARLKKLGKSLDASWVAIFDALRPQIFRCRICRKFLSANEAIDTNPHGYRKMKTTRYCTLCYEDSVRSQLRRASRGSFGGSGSNADRDYHGGTADSD